MLYSFPKLKVKTTDYLIKKIDIMNNSFHNITTQIRRDCILGIDYGLPNLVNDGLRKAIFLKNDKAIDVFLAIGADPEIAKGVIIEETIKNNNHERLKMIIETNFDLSEYVKIPDGIKYGTDATTITNNLIYEGQQNYLKSKINSIHTMSKENLLNLINEELNSLDYHKIYQNLSTFFTCLQRFTYIEANDNHSYYLMDTTRTALNNKNDAAITALATIQIEYGEITNIKGFIDYANETKNLYLLDLVIDNKSISLDLFIPVPQFLYKEEDNLFTKSFDIGRLNTLGTINQLFKEQFRNNNFNNSVFEQHQISALQKHYKATPLTAPTLSDDEVKEKLKREQEQINAKNKNNKEQELLKEEQEKKFLVDSLISKRRIDSIEIPPPPITEKIKYKAEIKVPYKHILNSKNEIVSIDEIQKKWDIALITESFNTGETKKMKDFMHTFMLENHTSMLSIIKAAGGLKRSPLKGISSQTLCDSSKFIENYIPRLHKVLKNKTKENVLNKMDAYLKFLDEKIITTQRLKEIYENPTTPKKAKLS